MSGCKHERSYEGRTGNRICYRCAEPLPRVKRPNRGTQEDRTLTELEKGEWVCGNVFLNMHMARYSARIYTLRRMGWSIESEPCPTKAHQHEAPVYRFRLQ